MSTAGLPGISVILPTLNSEKTLAGCLESIISQEYPKDKLEIIIADAGSKDKTLEILQRIKDLTDIPLYRLENPLRTGEAGKAVAAKKASREILAFIDSDNILPDTQWFKRMVQPFQDPQICAAEPISYTYRRKDGALTRYCALLGMNDPLCLFLGNYDRKCAITGKWTGLKVETVEKEGYLLVHLRKNALPTIGANGFLIRACTLMKKRIGEYLFDIDILAERISEEGGVTIAKVDTGIIHVFAGNISAFARKQKRRVKDYYYFRARNTRTYDWNSLPQGGVRWFIAACLLVFPLIYQAAKGLRRKPDPAWLLHPLLCWITLWQYASGTFAAKTGHIEAMERKGWSQE